MSNGQRLGLQEYNEQLKASPLIFRFQMNSERVLHVQVARKSMQPFLGPGGSKRLRPVQDMEARVLLYDLMKHGNTSNNSGILVAHEEDIPHGHWYIPVRRFVSDRASNVDILYRISTNILSTGGICCDGIDIWQEDAHSCR